MPALVSPAWTTWTTSTRRAQRGQTAGVTFSPPPPTIREQIAAEALVELSRSFTGLARSDSIVNNWSPPVTPSAAAGTGAAGGGLGLSSWTTGMVRFASPPVFPAPVTLTRSVTGFNYRPSDAVVEEEEEEQEQEENERDGTGTLPADSPRAEKPVTLSSAQAETTAESLREMIQILRERQDKVYDQKCRSHDEMAAQDAEWDELDRKIAELDDIMAVLEA